MDSEKTNNSVGTAKVLVTKTDEITDVIEEIRDNSAGRIIVSIPAGSDLLLSSVSLKLMLNAAEKADKKVVLVTDDATGQRMARLAGFSVRESMNDVDDGIWSRIEKRQKEKMQSKTEAKTLKDDEEASTQKEDSDPQDNLQKDEKNVEENDSMTQKLNEDDSEFINRDFQDDFGRSEGDLTQSPPDHEVLQKKREISKENDNILEGSEAKDRAALNKEQPADNKDDNYKGDYNDNEKASSRVKPGRDIQQKVPSVRKVSKGNFEMTIDNGTSGNSGDNNSVQDKPVGKIKSSKNMGVGKNSSPKRRSLVGRDLSAVDSTKPSGLSKYDDLPLADENEKEKSSKKKSGNQKAGFLSSTLQSVSGFFKKNFSGKALKKKVSKLKGKKLLPYLGALLIVFVGIGAFMMWYLPEIFVDIKVESIPVDFEGQVTAATSADSMDARELVIPAKQEVVTNNGSDNGDATGTGARGETASGEVMIFNKTDQEVVLEPGTILSNGGLNFSLQNQVSLEASPLPGDQSTSATGSVVAAENGSEYNLEQGTQFAVGDYALGEVNAVNPQAFSGGTSTEYTFVSQDDIDRVADKVEKNLYDESKGDLERKADDNRWVFMADSIKNEIEGDVKSDVPVGAEESSVNVTVNTRSTGLYYDSEALDALIEEVLLNDLEDGSDMEGLSLADDIQKDIEVSEVTHEAGEIKISVKVSGYVMPELDEKVIENALVGRGWADGLGYLKGLDYVSGDPEIEFLPEWFPKFMRRMPSRKDNITVDVENVVPGENEENEEEGGEDNQVDGNGSGENEEGTEE